MKTVVPGVEALPQNLSAVQVYNRLQSGVPRRAGARRSSSSRRRRSTTREVEAAIDELRARGASRAGASHEPVTVEVNDARTVARIELPIAGTGQRRRRRTPRSRRCATRSSRRPSARLDGVEAGVTGETAISKDFDDAMRGKAPLVFAFVLAFAFLLLLVSFRSIVIAVKAIVLNLLSVAAAYGVLVLVFQHGWGKRPPRRSTTPAA